MRAQLPDASMPLSHRDAQLVLAREYGFAGWQDLVKEVKHRLGEGLEWAASEARRRIHDNDVEGLRQLLTAYPALLSWKADEDDRGLLGLATGSYGDSGNSFNEEHFTRLACAELLIDAGAFVAPAVCDGLLRSRAKGLLILFHRKGLLPKTLEFFAALGDVDSVRSHFERQGGDLTTVNKGFIYACRFEQVSIASLLLERSTSLDENLGKNIDKGPGDAAFVEYMMANANGFEYVDFDENHVRDLWKCYAVRKVILALKEGDLEAFVDGLRRETWMLSDAWVQFQARLIEVAVLNDRGAFITALYDLDPALLHSAPPASPVMDYVFDYVKTHLLPLVQRVWPFPDDLPHAAGIGDLERVKRWFDAGGKPALGDLGNHFPVNNPHFCSDFKTWFGAQPGLQRVLDTALAWAVINNHFEVADFLLAHGADINTNWCSHEPASILHELVWYKNYEAMQFLIDRGIDMTIRDFRWQGTAEGWARVAAKDEKLGQFLREAQQKRQQTSR